MKYIEVDEELYRHIASKTEHIGESASDILRRLLGLSIYVDEQAEPQTISQPSIEVVRLEPQLTPKVDTVETQFDFNQLVDEHKLEQQKGAVGRFLFLLESLYQQDQTQFSHILQIQGRDRLYFARTREELLNASVTANPKEISHTGFWVTTNNNTAKKRAILAEVLVHFGCDVAIAKGIAERV